MTPALLHESGADVRIVMRKRQVVWNGAPLGAGRPLVSRLREPEAGLGSGWRTWFYSRQPAMFRHLPESTRIYRARTALGPAGASWLRGRVEGEFPILTGYALAGAAAGPDGVRLDLTDAAGRCTELSADHVIAATGYRPDLSPAVLPGPGAAGPAAHGGPHPGARSGLPGQPARALCGRPRGGADVRPGNAVRVRHGARGADRVAAGVRRGRRPADLTVGAPQ